ncbi:DUF1189 domain-containing protein [Fictibacillus sp. Mic-4]|uniref:DUF1189 domain-containing protein n=1 Tax=Fictibacillus TaxID=1329200 RepID=UPI00040E225B|nr:DUF1189 domain-containing protein [Fictibacillus gelatini]
MNIVKQLILSLYSPKDIVKFRFQGIGKTIGYIFFLTFLTTLPFGIIFSLSLKNGVEEFKQSLETDIPSFQLSNGHLTSNEKKPYIQTEDDQTIILDTTGTISMSDINNYSNVIALLPNELVVKAGGNVSKMPYSVLGTIEVTKNDVLKFSKDLSDLLPIIIMISMVILYIFTTASKFIGVTVLAVIGLFIQNAVNRKLSFRHLWRLSAYSVTLPTVFFALMDAFRIFVPFSFIIYWAVAIIMIWLVIKEVPPRRV